MINQANVISDLIIWIEKNLEQPLSIDHVADKSGYSKWHLQRMFKKVTGQILGTYIRHRRLTHAALALRLTSKPILDIAMQYRFDSQQTFTRSFKKQFNDTPATYRRNEFWDPVGLTPPIELNKTQFRLPEPTFMDFPQQVFWGVTYKNNCSLNELLQHNAILRKQFFVDYLDKYFKNNAVLPNEVYSFSQIYKGKEHFDEQEVLYTIAIEDNNILDNAEKYISQGGLYLCFKYIGPPSDLVDFISQIYFAAIPMLKVKLRHGDTIEIHHNHSNLTSVSNLTEIPLVECDYCVPVIMKDDD
ncbi:MDR efflux pump AcrAB transcriptional activator RobA [Orbus wheelerorum]|uniref:MDR efflux pump AcrAB transcriptional activator RobA n=1 Tax=Orbus wheelerorum TaxID=3074111 RepID=UPI00370D9FCA